MKALVTGVAGFVGSTLAQRLAGDGHEVLGIDAFTDYYDPQLKRTNVDSLAAHDVSIVEGSLNEVDLQALLDGVDVVFHQAGQPGVRKSWGSDFSEYIQQNIQATQRLLEAAKDSTTLKRLVYASSSSVYGDAQRYPTVETDRPQPVSPYGVTKLAAEHLCTLYARNFAVPTLSLRYFTVYGPRQRPDMAFTRFVHAAIADQPITLYGSGEQVRDFTFIDDVVEANVLAASSKVAAGSVYNVAGGTNISVNGVLDILESIHGRTIAVNREPTVAGDVFRTGGLIERITVELGWTPRTSIETGLRQQYEWAASSRSVSNA
ncbi:NAD-dependent epimerase/dehydratase family protein [soil metagenome]